MSRRRRVLIVVVADPEPTPQVPSWRRRDLPPRDAALLASQLLAWGAEVRVIDLVGEGLGARVARREVALWRADLVLVYAGGPTADMDPVPDIAELRRFAAGEWRRATLVACGPLAQLYGTQLLEAVPALAGALRGGISRALMEGDLDAAPGLVRRGTEPPGDEAPPFPDAVLPAWQLLPMAAYEQTGPRAVPVAMAPGGAERAFAEVTHAVRRGGARVLVFEDADVLADPRAARDVSRGMMAAAPGVGWTVNARADHVDPLVALTLSRGGCRQVTLRWPSDHAGEGLPPMDDPHRPVIENAVDVIRVTGMSPVVEFVVGRPGHSLEMLEAWQRWLRDRDIAVRPRVRITHPTPWRPDHPRLDEALALAGCVANALEPAQVQRAVRWLSAGRTDAAAAAP